MTKIFRGCHTVTVTPFTADGSAVCIDSLRNFLDWQLACGVPGVIVLGTTGEFLTVTDDERNMIVETTVKHVAGRMDVLVGTSDAYTPRAVRFSREAENLGADGLMIIPPYYYTPTDDEIFAYYRAISEAVSIPIMLYNNPFTSNVDMSAGFVIRLTRALENVRYIKEASMDIGRVFDIVEGTQGVMNVYAGQRPVESFLLGAVGYVNPYGNYLPYSTARMWDHLVAGELEPAKAIQAVLKKIDQVIAAGHPTYGHQCYSKALSAAMGYPMGDVRAPLTRFSELGAEGEQRLAKVLALCKEMDELMTRFRGAEAAE
jgi:4-hydroxy-tetrahydrodipicolinate synthase